jgi:murein DD-endopeptidase MepM/ murein hydrolase activator NlpD
MVRKHFALCALCFLAAFFSAYAQETDSVKVYTRDSGEGAYEILADNAYIIPVWVRIEFSSLVNMEASAALPFGGLVPARSKEVSLFRLQSVSGKGRRGYKMTVSYAKADPGEARPDESVLYLFPFAHGTKHRVTQGYNGAFTHQGLENQYALDFDLDTGTPVFAARGGLVFDVKKNSNRGGPSTAYNRDANYISVLHEDGTIGNYIHLRQNGALVSPGDQVAAGQHIGYSGNTGVSSGPHLHFDVQKPSFDAKMHSLPVRFLGYDGKAVEAEEDGYYYARHPGGPDFPVVFGSALKDEDFAGHAAAVAKTGKVDLRFERIDATYKVFVQNGTEAAKEVIVDFNLRNLVPSQPEPLRVSVPALTENFLLLLRSRPKATSWEYGYSIRVKDASR